MPSPGREPIGEEQHQRQAWEADDEAPGKRAPCCRVGVPFNFFERIDHARLAFAVVSVGGQLRQKVRLRDIRWRYWQADLIPGWTVNPSDEERTVARRE